MTLDQIKEEVIALHDKGDLDEALNLIENNLDESDPCEVMFAWVDQADDIHATHNTIK